MENNYAVLMRGVTKTFGPVYANKDVDLHIKKGEILSLLGENGSGKTTIMNMLAGIYYPDSGQIFINSNEVSIRSPKDAFDLGIGMIHQHFKLVDVFSATENVALGLEKGVKFNKSEIAKKVQEICNQYGFDIDPNQKVYNMSVSQKQTLEIIKVLYKGADILILDEPTAVLTPQETQKLFDILKKMREDGKSIVIITHKLHEVLSISDRVAVLRKGEYIGDIPTNEADENILTEMMVGQKVSLNIDRPEVENKTKRLQIKNLTCINKDGITALDNVSFTANAGEILGIAGIAGSGQKELLEAVAGLQKIENGQITYIEPETGNDNELVGKTPLQIRKLGVALSFVPEDRLGMGLVGSMGMTGNMMLRSYRKGISAFTNTKDPKNLSKQIMEDLDVKTPNISTPVRRLSGGNVQKVLVGREIAAAPTVLMTAYAVRGLDINTSYTIYRLLNEQKQKGVSVIYVGEDLDVLLELSDRILVLCEGKVSGIVDGKTATKEELGMLMTGTNKGESTND